MEIKNSRNNISRYVSITSLILFCTLIISIGILFIDNSSYQFTIASLKAVFIDNPILYVQLAIILVIPVVVYFLLHQNEKRIIRLQNHLDSEKSKVGTVENNLEKLIQNEFDAVRVADEDSDSVFRTLVELRDKMNQNKTLVDQQRLADEKRNWHAEGLAKFGAILRENSSDMEMLAFSVIKNLVNYIKGIQGGFYLLEGEDSEKYFDLKAFYAYGRKKYADKRIEWNKGLIGTTAKERKTILLKKIPDSYILVTSGLGQANPRNLVLCPMQTDEELFGVLEIASLNEITEDFIKFTEEVAESVASTISSVRMNMRTSTLLKETKEQAQALLAQEEEMRQNMEELQATQEEAARQATRFMRLETTVNHTMIRAEYNVNGTLIYANTKFLRKLEYNSNSQIEGKPIHMFLSERDHDWFKRIWDDLAQGGRHFEGYMKHVTRTGKDLWTMATYTCMRNEEGEVDCILFLAIDSTDQKELSLNMEGIVDAVNRSSIRIEFDINGNIKDFNDSFMYLFKYSEKETAKLNVADLIDQRELDDFNNKWESIVNGMNFQGQFKVKDKNGDEKWIRGAFSAVFDMYKDVSKVIYIGQDITNVKQMEIEFKQQNEILRQQEKKLRDSEKDLSIKLREARQEMQNQFKEIEKINKRNERTLEGALDAIITTSDDSKILFYNKAAEGLLGFKNEEVINKDISILFTEEQINENAFTAKYVSPNSDKVVGVRQEIKMQSKNGEEVPVLILLSKANVDKENTFTAFIQTIEVELF